MTDRLQNDICRCYGNGCTQKTQCKRFLTLPLDEAHDQEHGPRVRSYTDSMQATSVEPECLYFIEGGTRKWR